jgi:arsenate reductase
MLKIYHNPRCKKSRAGLNYLEEKGLEFETVLYLKNPLSEEEFTKLLMKLKKSPEEMIRTQEDYYKKELKGRQFNEHEWIKIILENPKLLKRPIVETDKKAIWGDPVDEIELIL